VLIELQLFVLGPLFIGTQYILLYV